MSGLALHRLRTRLRPLVPRRLRPVLTSLGGRAAALALRGDAVSCPCCHARLRRFVAYPSLYCPRCGSYERHRLLALLLERRPGLLAPPLRLLQISPDRPLERLLARPGIDRVTIDVDNPAADLRMDVRELKFENASFDAVLALAILDEVPDKRRAVEEMRRVLRPAGSAIVQVAVPEQQPVAGALAGAGFDVEVLRAADLGDAAVARHGLIPAEETFVCRRRE
jgi:hypothetical protein